MSSPTRSSLAPSLSVTLAASPSPPPTLAEPVPSPSTGPSIVKLGLPAPNTLNCSTEDNTPTPVRFFREVEASGLFQDLKANPFDEHFRQATQREEEKQRQRDQVPSQAEDGAANDEGAGACGPVGPGPKETSNTSPSSIYPTFILQQSTTASTMPSSAVAKDAHASDSLNTPQIIDLHAPSIGTAGQVICLDDGTAVSSNVSSFVTAAATATTSLPSNDSRLSKTATVAQHVRSPMRPIAPKQPITLGRSSSLFSVGDTLSGGSAQLVPAKATSLTGKKELLSEEAAQLLLCLPNGDAIHLSDMPVMKPAAERKESAAVTSITTKAKLRDQLMRQESAANSRDVRVGRPTQRMMKDTASWKRPDAGTIGGFNAATTTAANGDAGGDGDGDSAEVKRQKLLERNRAAAHRSREKRRKEGTQQQRENEQLRAANRNLFTENQVLRQEVTRLKRLLEAHLDCSLTRESGQQEVILEEIQPKAVALKSDVPSGCAATLATQIKIITVNPLDVIQQQQQQQQQHANVQALSHVHKEQPSQVRDILEEATQEIGIDSSSSNRTGATMATSLQPRTSTLNNVGSARSPTNGTLPLENPEHSQSKPRLNDRDSATGSVVPVQNPGYVRVTPNAISVKQSKPKLGPVAKKRKFSPVQ